jgi:hypothetical protein
VLRGSRDRTDSFIPEFETSIGLVSFGFGAGIDMQPPKMMDNLSIDIALRDKICIVKLPKSDARPDFHLNPAFLPVARSLEFMGFK